MIQRKGPAPEVKRTTTASKWAGWMALIAAGVAVGALIAWGVHGQMAAEPTSAAHASANPVVSGSPVPTPTHTSHGVVSAAVPKQRVATPSASVSRAAAATKGKPVPAVSAAPVSLSTTSGPTPGIEISVTGLTAVAGKGTGTGMVDGPSLLFNVVVKNAGTRAQSLAGVAVNTYYGKDHTPALQLNDPRAVAMPTSVAAGSAAAGSYVFKVPTNERAKVRITVDFASGVPVSVFDGSVK